MKSLQSGCETATPPPLPSPAVDAMPGRGRQSVLIIETNALARDTYWAALLEAGYRGVAAPKGKNVFDIMFAESVSVILLDLSTPGVSVETLTSIKRASPETLVVAMGEDESRRDGTDMAAEMGADAFVRKPASPAAVMDAVNTLTSRSAATGQADRRRYTRLKVDQQGYLYSPPDNKPLECRIVNLSAGGALIHSEFECPRDRPLVLHVDGFGSFEGVVARSSNGSTGFKFLMDEFKRDRLKQALASFAKTGVAPIGTYGQQPEFESPEWD